ncbi:TM2 domain-containing protein CG10795 [Chelonus insularis]|uniref:TM2 domain-containing protein CG10795 n=1 Tax=Chelonus insularis TaxID=460826 RepID=UPI00158D7963|nr:TM2 domain-containing protein CG10795 [Chelonus insularis]
MKLICYYIILIITLLSFADGIDELYEIDCDNLRIGQYICPRPDYDLIDPKTQQIRGCTKENKAKVECLAADGLKCIETKNNTFKKDIPCKWTNGYSFETAVLLSIFLGMFGIDRFYLGYPAIGLLKLCTLGFLFIGQFCDVILIATQIVGPADGSHYVMPYYGAGVTIITSDESTYRIPQQDW